MANQIINNLLISGAIMRGSVFQSLQRDFADVFSRKKEAKKAITDRTQNKYINEPFDTDSCGCSACYNERKESDLILC
jgi:hypothetical protein